MNEKAWFGVDTVKETIDTAHNDSFYQGCLYTNEPSTNSEAPPFLQIQTKTDWDSAKKVLADSSFMDKLKNYDKVTGSLDIDPRESKTSSQR